MRALGSVASLVIPMLLVLAPPMAGAAEYAAAYAPAWPQNYPPGATVSISVTVMNTGDLTWNKAPDAQNRYFVLGYHWNGPEVHHAGENQVAWPWAELPSDVAKNQTVVVNVQLPVPSTPGVYTLQWDMVHLGATWFTGCCGVPGAGARNAGASKTVTVGRTVSQVEPYFNPSVLCELVECDKSLISPALVEAAQSLCVTPKVESFMPFLTAVTPDGGVMLLGCGFGSAPGELWMFAPFVEDIPGTWFVDLPGGPVKLTDLEWSETGIAGRIPSGITVVNPLLVQFEVTTAGGLKAYSPYATFKPQMEWKRVPRSAVSVVKCSFDADVDKCNNELDTDGEFIGPPGGDEAIRGHHHNNWGSFPDTAEDKYEIVLKNNHTFVSVQESTWGHEAGDYYALIGGIADVQGQSSLGINVPWYVGGDDAVHYSVDLWVEGPVNVEGW